MKIYLEGILNIYEKYTTLDELGDIIHCAKSTVKGYENGSRKPDLQMLKKLSAHYNKTVDELIDSDLTDFGKIAIDLDIGCQVQLNIQLKIWWGLCYIINVYYCEQFSYKGSTENEYKKVIGWSLGIGGTVASAVLLKKALPKEVANVAVKAVTEPEKTFGGVRHRVLGTRRFFECM